MFLNTSSDAWPLKKQTLGQNEPLGTFPTQIKKKLKKPTISCQFPKGASAYSIWFQAHRFDKGKRKMK